MRGSLVAAAAAASCLVLLSGCGAGETAGTQAHTQTEFASAAASPQPTPTPTPSATTSATPSDSTDGWTAFSDTADSFSLRYPPNWHVFGPCRGPGEGSGYNSQVRISPQAADICGADNYDGDIIINVHSAPGSPPPTPSACTDVSSVTISGVQGTRWTRTSSACGDYPFLAFQFVTGGRFYIASTDGFGTSANLTSQLDLIVRDTWGFHP